MWAGLSLITLAGIMGGSFTAPQKAMTEWSWEAGWLFYSVCGMLVLPLILLLLFIPGFIDIYAGSGFQTLLRCGLFGAGWGVGSVLFGLAASMVGSAIAFSVVVSLSAALGSLIPLLVLHPDQALSRETLLLALGLIVVCVGVVLLGRAGTLRERGRTENQGGTSFLRGLGVCIASGIMSPMLNFGLAFGEPIRLRAIRAGAAVNDAALAPLAFAIACGFFVNAGYCVWLLRRNRSFPHKGWRNLNLAAGMGFLWMMGMYLYGLGATHLGSLGSVIGWPLFMIGIILTGSAVGVISGEWRGAARRARLYFQLGNLVILASILLICQGANAG